MKIIFLKFRLSIFSNILLVLILIVGCDLTMIKELDIERLAFPPKLSITAILDCENRWFEISLMEGRSLADYAKPVNVNKKILRDGEIRLFEDGILIQSIQGPFDMSIDEGVPPDYQTRKNGYRRILTGIIFKPGSVYRLEADVEGYPIATSTAVMPVAPVISASMDTSKQVIRKNVREIYSMGYSYRGLWNETLPDKYWPVSVQITDPDPNVINYFALDILKMERIVVDNTQIGFKSYYWGIGGSGVSILLEEDMNNELLGNEHVDLYLFSMLPTNDLAFSWENPSRTFYAAIAEIPKHQNNDDSQFEDDPDFEKITTRHSLSLRVTHVPPVVFHHYRSLNQNFTGGLVEQPVLVVSNIENGYGVFSALNSARVYLLEWETYEYRKKEE